jgi:hypothetical protein
MKQLGRGPVKCPKAAARASRWAKHADAGIADPADASRYLMWMTSAGSVALLGLLLSGCRDARRTVDAEAPSAPSAAASPASEAAAPTRADSDSGDLDARAARQDGPKPKIAYERFEPLGPHYRLRHYGIVPTQTGRGLGMNEGIIHYEGLLFGDTTLSSHVGAHWPSPDGNYVVYEDGEGHNLVHSAISNQTRSATPSPYAIPGEVVWDLPHGQVRVLFRRPTAPITVTLP